MVLKDNTSNINDRNKFIFKYKIVFKRVFWLMVSLVPNSPPVDIIYRVLIYMIFFLVRFLWTKFKFKIQIIKQMRTIFLICH